ncbi:MAG: hypothetical protein ACE5GQ_10425 [Nitrospinales bacterium]
MPNRIIKEEISGSESLAQCSIGANLLFDRLLTSTDDYGCFDARPPMIRGNLFPLMLDKINQSDITTWLKELEKTSCICLWEDKDGRRYGWFPGFEKHNDLGKVHSPKTPCPPWLLNENGMDPRLPTETLAAFENIQHAIEKIEKAGGRATYEAISKEAKASRSTVAKFFKNKESIAPFTPVQGSTPQPTSVQPDTEPYISVQHGTENTPKTLNLNPNTTPNLNHKNLSCPESKKPDSERGEGEKNRKYTEEDLEFSRYMFSKVSEFVPSMTKGKNKLPDLNQWANEVRLMRERDGHSIADIRAMYEWVLAQPTSNGGFSWKANIRSPGKLREKWPDLEARRICGADPPISSKLNGNQQHHKPAFRL